MIISPKQNTYSFVSKMSKYIHSNINLVYTYTNTDVFTIPPNLFPTLSPSVGSYKVAFFCLFMIKF